MTTPEQPAAPRLVEVANITKRTGDQYNDTDTATVEDYIESVTAVVLDEGLPSWTATTAPARVRVIVVDAVQRRLNNPEQMRQRTLGGDLEMYGPADDGEWLTDGELKTVRRLAGKAEDGSAGTVVTSSRTTLPPERLAVLRTDWDRDDDPDARYVATFPL